ANTVYTIYQALKPLSGGTATFLGGSVRKLGEINHPDTIAQVRMKSLDSKIYFGVTVKHQDKEGFNLVENESFVAINSDKVQNPEEDEQSKVKDNQEEDSVDKQQEEGSIEKEPEENAKDK
ncbi:hypothetical protein IQA55_09965, partial [Leptospira borgpetersenii serovar Tarassovi]|nr:hypothetical protein [Leptospira borgpetersenii serovar Tarassovi]